MNRRTFLLSIAAASLVPTVTLARPRRYKRFCYNPSKILRCIRLDGNSVVNKDFIFEQIPFKPYGYELVNDLRWGRTLLGDKHRQVHAWLNEEDAQKCTRDDGRAAAFWGEVLVGQWGRGTCEQAITFIMQLPESRVKLL